MATLREVYAGVLASDEEKKAFGAALSAPDGLGAFLAERGCDATPEQVEALLKEKAASSAEIDDEQLCAAAGGQSSWSDFELVGIALQSLVEATKITHGDYGDLTITEWVWANRDILLCMEGIGD